MTDPLDELAALLAPGPDPSSPALREAIFQQTQGRLARGRRLRRCAEAGLVAGILALGGLAGWMARSPTPSAGVAQPPIEFVAVPVVVPLVINPYADPPGASAPPLSAAAAELLAEQADDAGSAAQLYRKAGDAFLGGQDYTNATRCYRLYLARAGNAALALQREDSWLLVSLKNAAYKERINVTKNDG